jgi:hypothetical protein
MIRQDFILSFLGNNIRRIAIQKSKNTVIIPYRRHHRDRFLSLPIFITGNFISAASSTGSGK